MVDRQHQVYKKIRNFLPSLYTLAGSFIIAFGWGWYHFSWHHRLQLFGKLSLVFIAVIFAYLSGKNFYDHTVRRLKVDQFWHAIFAHSLDQIFFVCSLLFGIFFSTNELLTLAYSFLVFAIIFGNLQSHLSRHPRALELLKLNRAYFIVAGFIFVLEAVYQYSAYHYYILDSNLRYFNIVFFRTVAMTIFLLFGFALASLCLVSFKRWWRWLGFVIWGLTFAGLLIAWAVNIGILYYSGLYLSPVALGHSEGAGRVIFNPLSWFLIVGLVASLVVFALILRRFVHVHRSVPKEYVRFYALLSILAAGLVIFGLTSFRNTPEAVIIKSFYDFYFALTPTVTLDPALRKKLATFGLEYNPEAFYVNQRSAVYSPTAASLLPKKFQQQKPNVMMVFVESFSARFSGVYNPKLSGVTPNFDAFANDPATTVFYNYYNASTPTITGTLSQLCSFLPPTGHNEIQNERKLQNHHLLCLPEILKKYAGFKHAAYITAVDKEYAHKDGIFTSMAVDKIYGTSELAKFISGEPLSWGYSDHQLFPAFLKFAEAAQQPWLMMLATVDTHPPFDLPKDPTNYGDGKQPVLNMFHTTDDAFGKFWRDFKQSSLYNNTIVVVVADHAIFPGAITTDIFPNEAGQLTYYDQNFLAIHVPESVLPKKVDVWSSSLDVTPTLLQVLGVTIPNSFEGRSIFDDRKQYPNLLGMHELGLYINQVGKNGQRQVSYNLPTEITCAAGYRASSTPDFTLCDYLQFFHWKRAMFEQGRFWKKD